MLKGLYDVVLISALERGCMTTGQKEAGTFRAPVIDKRDTCRLPYHDSVSIRQPQIKPLTSKYIKIMLSCGNYKVKLSDFWYLRIVGFEICNIDMTLHGTFLDRTYGFLYYF